MEGRAEFEQFEQFEERTLEAVRKAEETALDAGRKWATAVADAIPVDVPGARQIVKDAMDFTERVLRLQREFVHDVVKAVPSLLPGTTTRKPSAPRRTTATHGETTATRPVRRAAS
jgi:hypothetical protein